METLRAGRRAPRTATTWIAVALGLCGCNGGGLGGAFGFGCSPAGRAQAEPMAGSVLATGGVSAPPVGADGSTIESGQPDDGVAPRADLGVGNGSDVITIGDSWMNAFLAGIQQSLVRVAMQPYRTYGVGGTRLLNGQIPRQYTQAKQANPDIKTVIMTGGGNDIIQVPGLQENCEMEGEQCGEVVTDILDGLSSLWAEMAADGVQDVVYVMYSEPDSNDVDFEMPDGDSAVVRCAEVPEPLRCHTLATGTIVMGDLPDTIHPSGAGFDRIAVAVYDLMVEQGMRR